ncbi:metallophosphoesterase [Treponema primitia]|uniref:metallophosphoesterase family protein n=1 Tax=Treponema primitia TaxID=88058 RepID=UPI0039811A5B
MVVYKINQKMIHTLLIIFSLITVSCSLPQYYNEYDSRFSYHDIFNYLSQDERTLDLGDSYSFIVLSDIHISDSISANEFAKLKSRLGDAQFIVITGDITQNGTKEEIQKFIDVARTFGIPCYPVMGNHDIYTNRAGPWEELIGSSCYRIDSPSGDTTLFMLDNANGSFGHDQIEWLEKEMKSAKDHTFVFAHDNFFTENGLYDYEQITDINERARVMSLLKGQCDIMFMGHLHKRIVKKLGGVTYIMVENYGASEATGTICRVHVSREGINYTFEKI